MGVFRSEGDGYQPPGEEVLSTNDSHHCAVGTGTVGTGTVGTGTVGTGTVGTGTVGTGAVGTGTVGTGALVIIIKSICYIL